MQPRDIGRLAIYYESEAFSMAGRRLMGRQSAGAGFLKAVVGSKPRELWCYTRSRGAADSFQKEVREHGGGAIAMHWIHFVRPDQLGKVGLLFRPDPGIAYDSWRRLTHSQSRAYSICGITHTTATHAVMEAFNGLLAAPLEEWDALICTSNAVRDSLQAVIENNAAYLRERLGATRLSLPQLPVIPLGVHCKDFESTEDQRAAARHALGIAPDQVVVLFVGRLSFHGKAHPMPMYLGLEACARETPTTLIQAGWFASDAIERAFKEEAQKLCPSVRCLFVDGRNAERRGQAWSAADIFTSMSDNIQETFGLSPLEGMAAGLPVVVSDWNGYRDTVRHGVDGFRVPTLSLPPGSGGVFADRYDMNIDNYDFYTGSTSQLTAIDVTGATEAYRRLLRDRDLRRRMGEAARERARSAFDWSVVMNRYADLWAQLAELRRASPSLHTPLTRRRRPDRADPFTMFATYPTHTTDDGMGFRRRPGITLETALARRELHSTKSLPDLMAPPEFIQLVFSLGKEDQHFTISDVLARAANYAPAAVARALVWLAKVGVLTFEKIKP